MPRRPCTARVALLLLLLLAGLPAAPAVGAWPAPGPASWPVPDPSPAQRLLQEINRVRWEQGHIPPLKHNPVLEQVAQAHCLRMSQDDFFGHKGSDKSTPWDRIDAGGYGNWYTLAENIAAGYGDPAGVVQAWMQSPQHRENMLNPELHEAGIGYVYEPDDTLPGDTWGYRHYWTLDMGSRWDDSPLIIAGESYSTTTHTVTLYFYGADWASELRLSNDGRTWSAWQPYRPDLLWEIMPGSGVRHVYGQLRDAQGNLMQSEDEILLVQPPATPGVPGSLSFLLRAGADTGRPLKHRVWFSDPTGGTQVWRASWDQDWLRLSAEASIAPEGLFAVLARPARSLKPGTYTAEILFHSATAEVKIPVRLLVLPRLFSVFLPYAQR